MQMNEAERSTTSKWPDPVRNALFSDASGTSLRSQDEIKANWSKLTAEQQSQIKQDCNTMQTASATGAGSASGSASGSAAGTTPQVSGETTASTSTGSTSSGSAAGTQATGGAMTIAQLCTMVNAM
ncbi:hypothetical protein [Sinorhizobium fredii]|uniref:Uncharacterized protein n=1 Tax=Rhizobium fredii TaxID=380 RepID=A0A2L0HFZ1_RHIFR|nr:hypothetical protein [Sinorhizobium fredii]AUX80385.1 hypothetical protein NXT3_PC01231 [Sinorhizobium fredii]